VCVVFLWVVPPSAGMGATFDLSGLALCVRWFFCNDDCEKWGGRPGEGSARAGQNHTLRTFDFYGVWEFEVCGMAG